MNPIMSFYRIAGFVILVALIALFGWIFWSALGENLNENINRAGMILELIGVLSVIPEIIGEEKIRTTEKKFGSLSAQFELLLKDITRFLREGFFDLASSRYLLPTGIIWNLLIVANTVGCLLLVLDLFYLKTPIVTINPSDKIFFYTIDISALVWLISGVIIFVYSKFSSNGKPTFFLKALFSIFFIAHLWITIFSLPFTMAFAILYKFILTTSLYLLKFSLRQVIAWVTLPLILLGNILQLISTFL